jgi:transcriptional regulator with XRE-family HTH domain
MTSHVGSGPGSRLHARRRRDLNERIGKQILGLREEAGVTQAELARCAGMAHSYLWKIEAGEAEPSTSVLLSIGSCLGADLSVRFFPGAGPRIHDRFQAPMVEALLRSLGSEWQGQPEVPVPAARGVLDLVLRRRDGGLVLACECHSELRRLELAIRRLAEKADALAGQLEGDLAVSRMLLIRSTAATRSIARAYEATLAAAFPARSAEAFAAITGGVPWPGPAILWVRLEAGRAEMLETPPRGVRLGR